jgi:hypothetical protein
MLTRRSTCRIHLPHAPSTGHTSGNGLVERADARTRTGDPFITSEVLYQLSYVGAVPTVAIFGTSVARATSR